MWERLKRLVRSFVGFFISVAEDPELILQQNIRDMNDQVPRMNESIAMVKANVTLLEREQAKYQDDIASLTAKVKAAIQANRDDIAGSSGAQPGTADYGTGSIREGHDREASLHAGKRPQDAGGAQRHRRPSPGGVAE